MKKMEDLWKKRAKMGKDMRGEDTATDKLSQNGVVIKQICDSKYFSIIDII